MTNQIDTSDAPTAVLADISGHYSIDPAHTRLGLRRPARDGDQGPRRVHRVLRHRPASTPPTREGPRSPSRSSRTASPPASSSATPTSARETSSTASGAQEITFVSTSVDRDGDEWTITGDLTIKGVTRPVSVPFEFTGSAKDPYGNVRIGFEGEVAINRKDWGLTWNAALETGGVMVSEKIKLEFDVSAIKVA